MFEKDFDKINLNNKLNDAVISQKCDEVKSLLSLDEPPFVDHEINGVPLILYAAQHKNWDIVEELYNAEANLDVKIDYFDWYLIHECVKSAPDRVTKAVIEYSNINAQTKDGRTALMVSIQENKDSMADYILDLKLTDLSLCDKNQENAAHYAAKFKKYDLLIKLIEHGCPVNKLNKEDKSPIDLIEDVAFRENLPKVLSSLKKLNVNSGGKKEKDLEVEAKEEQESVAEEKPKLSGLSKIKRK